MKNLFRVMLIAAVASFTLVSCGDDPVPPVAGFTYEPMAVVQNEAVTFTNTSTGATSYAWDFGDGSTSTEENPVHQFAAAETFTVTLVATNEDGEDEASMDITVAAAIDNHYMLDGAKVAIDSTMFWYQSPMGGDAYIRLVNPIEGQDSPDLLKLYPNSGVNELPGTYTWSTSDPMTGSIPAGSYDCGYTAGYAGMAYDWTAIGKTGSGDLVVETTDVADVYHVTGDLVLSVGSWDFSSGEFTETGTATLELDYTGVITPL